MYRDAVFTNTVSSELYRDTVFTIIVHPEMHHDTVYIGVVFPCSAVARALLCVSCLCWCSRHTCYLPVFSLEIRCRKAPNADASQLEGIPCHKWCSVLLRSAHLWCRGPGRNLAIWRCGPGREPGTLVVLTSWDLAVRSQSSCEGFCRCEV